MGSMLMAGPSDAGNSKPASKAQGSAVKPRHVVCFLGGANGLAPLSDAASAAIRDVATGFAVDRSYSQDKPDSRMVRSFGVSWDRVQPNAWSNADEEAVERHQSVLYVKGPPMTPETAVVISTGALMLVHRLIKAGATAVKGESAGVAHGLNRWNELIVQAAAALQSDDDFALGRISRLAFAKRPLASDDYLESVGFHLAGLPDVYVPKSRRNEREAVALMDAVADEMARHGVEATLKSRRAKLSFEQDYAEDDFKFNPYGIVKLPS
jgi:hypothetical protein